VIGSRLYFEHGFDFFMFADNESPWKSPFTWAKAVVAPGALTCQYASHFYDTDPTAVKAICTITILDDIIFWAFIATALGVASFSFSQDALRTLKEHTGEVAKKEGAAVVKVVLHQLLIAAEALAVAALVYVVSLTGYAPLVDAVFAYILIVTFVVNLQIFVEKLVEMGVLTNAFEDVLNHVFNVATWPVVLFLQTMQSFEDKAVPKPDFNQFEPVAAPAPAFVAPPSPTPVSSPTPVASPALAATSPSPTQRGAASPLSSAGDAPEPIAAGTPGATPGDVGTL
jgi:hypothetical protein